jgi:hypothetical protein
MLFPHLEWNRRLLIYGAIAGVVMELAVLGAFFTPKGLLPPIEGMSATQMRTLELLPFVIVGGAALLAGVGCFVASMVLTARKRRRKRPGRRAG